MRRRLRPPPPDVGELLADLCNAINDDLLPPLVQAALVPAQFETIHPFDDGNGRTGRGFLIHVVLRRRGIAPEYVPPISVLFAKARDRYMAHGPYRFPRIESIDWIRTIRQRVADSGAAHLASAYVQAVQDLIRGPAGGCQLSGVRSGVTFVSQSRPPTRPVN